MSRKSVGILLVFFCLMLTGCSTKNTTSLVTAETETRKLQIGVSFDSFVIERWTRDRDVFVSTAQDLGAEVNIQSANGVVEEQISQIQYFIKKKMDVIAIIAIDGEALQEVVAQAHDAGIKVICYDRLIMNAGADLYISFDNKMVGKQMGEAMKEAVPRGGNIFVIYGSQSDYNVVQVQQGITETLQGSNLNIAYSSYCDGWLAELAFDAVNEGLAQTSDIVGVICGNDDLASQAIKALSEHRLAGNVTVVAQDAELSACQRIVEGTQKMTVYKPVEELALIAARLAVALGEGKALSEENYGITVTETINDGTYEIPYYSIDPVPVTAENLDEVIIESGFHLKDDVYLNVK